MIAAGAGNVSGVHFDKLSRWKDKVSSFYFNKIANAMWRDKIREDARWQYNVRSFYFD
jgi:hypothetical protein